MRLRTVLLSALIVAASRAASAPAPPEPTIGREMDYGPFLSGSLDRDKTVSEKNSKESTEQDGPHPNALAAKAINVRLGDGVAGVAFDTDLLRYAAGWTGGFLDLSKTHLATLKGSTALTPAGPPFFTTPLVPGVSVDGKFEDPRPKPFGPMPPSAGRYNGFYRHGERVVFSYTVGDCHVLDTCAYATADGHVTIWRTLRLGPSRSRISI